MNFRNILIALTISFTSVSMACNVFVHCWVKTSQFEKSDNICMDKDNVDFTTQSILDGGLFKIKWKLVEKVQASTADYPSVQAEVFGKTSQKPMARVLLQNSGEDWGFLEAPDMAIFRCKIND